MADLAILLHWAEFAMRWLHVITAIAWVGSSFYFIALDLGLWQREGLPQGVHGEEWQVHGGGFYHIQKYNVAPAHLPEHLTWFKWESYATWMSGFGMLILVYYAQADLYLIDRNTADLPVWAAIVISVSALVVSWFAYSAICNSKLGDNPVLLMILLYAVLVAMAWGLTQVFTGRAALLHLGAITATLMSGNVFLVIIPNQKIVVADLIAGRTPDPKFGKIAKLRSTHNNYLTLPVLFLMLSNHYPLAFATEYNWIIASLVFLMGVTIRHYFNSMHARKGKPHWTWGASVIIFLVIAWLSVLPQSQAPEKLSAREQRFAQAQNFTQVTDIVLGRCSMCHAAEPFYDGVHRAPKNVLLETPNQIAAHATAIYLQSGISHAMPPGNVSYMEPQERAVIASWYRQAAF